MPARRQPDADGLRAAQRHRDHRRRSAARRRAMTEPQPNAPPLAGITVLDLTRVLSGPYCTMLLADMGARVIKVEQPGKGDDTRAWGPPFLGGESAYFLSINRNKESLTLDFKHAAARAGARAAARRGPMSWSRTSGRARWSGSASTTRRSPRRWPRLVYCSISGFGQTGPRRDEAGYDAVDAGRRRADEHHRRCRRPAVPARRRHRRHRHRHVRRAGHRRWRCSRATRTGRGQRVDVGMLDATAALLTYQAAIYFATGRAPRDGWATAIRPSCRTRRSPRRRRASCSPSATTSSGGASARACGLDALGEDPRFATNRAARRRLRRAAAGHRRAAADAHPRRVDRRAERRRRAVRLGARRRRGARRSAARRRGR